MAFVTLECFALQICLFCYARKKETLAVWEEKSRFFEQIKKGTFELKIGRWRSALSIGVAKKLDPRSHPSIASEHNTALYAISSSAMKLSASALTFFTLIVIWKRKITFLRYLTKLRLWNRWKTIFVSNKIFICEKKNL